jgi:hypothetical protein
MSDFSAWVEKNKALWTRVYDEVILPDLEEEWKKSTCDLGCIGRLLMTSRRRNSQERSKPECV